MKEKTERTDPRTGLDPALVARARTGDLDAFTELYQQTNPALYRSVRSMVRDEDLAWDILQDSYLRAFRSLDKLEADEAFLHWLRRIAVNETARQMSKRLPLSFTELGGEDQPELPDPKAENQPELALDRQESARLVREILAELPPQQQLIMGMRYYEELSLREIAELLQLSPGTVKTQLHFGRKKVETGVRALEKQGVKLYGLGPVPFLMALLRRLEPARAVEQKTLGTVLSQLPAAGVTTVTAMTAGQALLHGLGAKLAAGALALALIGGGIWAGSRFLGNSGPEIGDPRPSGSYAADEDLTVEPSAEPAASETDPATESTEPGATEPPITEPIQTFQTPEEAYDYVLDQYRLALADPAFTPEAYPLVNADAVSELSLCWGRYADDRASLYTSYYDLDKDGTSELIVSLCCGDVEYFYDNAGICGIYAFDGTGPVELLRGVGFGREDYVSVRECGGILLVENGFYASPAQITEYRLDAGACALLEQSQWTYTCTQTGERSFEGGDGALTPHDFYAGLGAAVQIVFWDQEPFLDNPGSAENTPVTDLEGVPWESGSRLPKITLEGEAYEAFNEAVRRELLESLQSDPDGSDGCDYGWSLNGDILCIWINRIYPGGWNPPVMVRRFAVSEGRELSQEELLARCGVSEAEFEEGLMPSLYGSFAREWDNQVYCRRETVNELSAESVMRAMKSMNRSPVELMLDRSGRLVCWAEVASLVGGSAYYHMVPVPGASAS